MAWETCVKTAVLPQIYRDTAPKNKNNNHSVHLKLYRVLCKRDGLAISQEIYDSADIDIHMCVIG